eukprot:s2140_g7.t1
MSTHLDLRRALLQHHDEVVSKILKCVRYYGEGANPEDVPEGLIFIDKADLEVRQHIEDLLQMHEAVAKTKRAEALAQQQADFQQSVRCWQRRLQVQAKQTKEEQEVQQKELETFREQSHQLSKETAQLREQFKLQNARAQQSEKELQEKADQLSAKEQELMIQQQALLEKQQLLREEQQSYQATADEMQKVRLRNEEAEEALAERNRLIQRAEALLEEQRKAQHEAQASQEQELLTVRRDIQQQREAIAAREAELRQREEQLASKETLKLLETGWLLTHKTGNCQTWTQQDAVAEEAAELRLSQREEALVERVQLASKREQSLQEREAAVAAREEEVTNVERNLREGMRQSRHLETECHEASRERQRDLDEREASLEEKAQLQAEEDQRLAERERRLASCEEELKMQKAENLRLVKQQEAALADREERLITRERVVDVEDLLLHITRLPPHQTQSRESGRGALVFMSNEMILNWAEIYPVLLRNNKARSFSCILSDLPPECLSLATFENSCAGAGSFRQHLLRYEVPSSWAGFHFLPEALGRGAFGVVEKAIAPDGWLVAVKTPKQDEDAPDLLREAHMLELCQHAKIVTLYYIIAATPHGLVMGLLGSNLLEFTDGKRATVQDYAHIAHDISQALYFPERQSVVHGDVKAANVCLAADAIIWPCVLKLCDFECAQQLPAHGYCTKKASGRMERSKTVQVFCKSLTPEQPLEVEKTKLATEKITLRLLKVWPPLKGQKSAERKGLSVVGNRRANTVTRTLSSADIRHGGWVADIW